MRRALPAMALTAWVPTRSSLACAGLVSSWLAPASHRVPAAAARPSLKWAAATDCQWSSPLPRAAMTAHEASR